MQRSESNAPPHDAQCERGCDAQPFSRQPTPAAELAVEQRNAEIKRREALITEAKLERRRRKKTKRRASLATLRVCELNRLYVTRYRGELLPDDDDGRDSVWIMINHLAMLSSPALRINDWLRRCAPWFHDQTMIDHALAKPQRWRADTLGKQLNVTDEERTRTKAWSIGAVDLNKEQRATRRQAKDRDRKQAKRQAAGAQSRAEFLARSLSHLKPWEAEGISRRTWERQRLTQVRPQMTHVRPQHILTPTADALASPVPGAPPPDAGGVSVEAPAERHPPPCKPLFPPSTTEVSGAVLEDRPRSIGCSRISVSNFDEAHRIRAAMLEEAALRRRSSSAW